MKKIVFIGAAVMGLAGLWIYRQSEPSGEAPQPIKPQAVSQDSARSRPQTQLLPEASSTPRPETVLTDDELNAWVQRAGKNAPVVMQEILQLQDADKRQELLDWVMDVWLSEGRAPVSKWISEYLQSPTAKAGDELLAQFIGGWVQESPLAAIQWVQKEVPQSWRKQAEKEVATAWADTDPASLDQWLGQPEQKALESFWTEELALGLIPLDPALAMQRTEKLAPETAASLQESILQSWLLEDPANAEAWVQKDGRFVTKLQQLRQGLDATPQVPKP